MGKACPAGVLFHLQQRSGLAAAAGRDKWKQVKVMINRSGLARIDINDIFTMVLQLFLLYNVDIILNKIVSISI